MCPNHELWRFQVHGDVLFHSIRNQLDCLLATDDDGRSTVFVHRSDNSWHFRVDSNQVSLEHQKFMGPIERKTDYKI